MVALTEDRLVLTRVHSEFIDDKPWGLAVSVIGGLIATRYWPNIRALRQART